MAGCAYTGRCGGAITEDFYGDTQVLQCQYAGRSMQCDNERADPPELCEGCTAYRNDPRRMVDER